MLSDDSSSDSETGRFKCQSKPKEEKKDSGYRGSAKSTENDRYRRDFGKRRHERLDHDKHSRDSNRRNSPVIRRKSSRDRSPRRSLERHRDRDSNRSRHHHSTSNDRMNSTSRSHKSTEKSRPQRSPEPRPKTQRSPEPHSKKQTPDLKTRIRSPEQRSKSQKFPEGRSMSHKSPERSRCHMSPERERSQKSPEPRRDLKKEIRRTLEPTKKSPTRTRRSEEQISLSPDYRSKRSEIHQPPPSSSRRKSNSPIIVEEQASDKSENVQVGSYYKMIPTVVMDKSEEESSEIDSSDDERLRAKLLNLEKELQKTKKKKHKKKHKRKSKSSGDKDEVTSVEVTSTTDIDVGGSGEKPIDVPEVSSTQKSVSKESSEEGEISSGDDFHSQEQYDASDLRHKLSRKPEMSKDDVCGPALPPHLSKRRSKSADREGPALPPHLTKPKNIGPSIPDNIRKVLSEKDCEVIEYASSDDDGIGPLPAGAEAKWSDAHQRLEERALDMKIRKLDGHSLDNCKIKSREEWMLELPEGKTKYLGLEARSFRAKEGPDMSDRSSWTDTPDVKAKKAAGLVREEDTDETMRRDARTRLINNRDEEQETAVKKHKKKHKRDESLLEQHERKMKKKKKKEEKDNDGKAERRPFSRDVDLQVNRFDEAQKKSIIKKAQGLNTRFSRGEAKYL